ncbi:hypothetical protein FACS1894195_4180 [Bacteroidia bacterium]|nr:hypothetical protein FACS1894195_4180 [Bacteroidia bacterium]
MRKLRQRECDNTELYSDTEIEYAEQKQRSQQNFIMLTAPCVHKSDPIARNTSTTYFSVFKAALKQAFIDGYLTIDLSAKIKNIPKQ